MQTAPEQAGTLRPPFALPLEQLHRLAQTAPEHALAVWLWVVLAPMVGDPEALSVEHQPNVPVRGEHTFVVFAPASHMGLLVGKGGKTARCIRALAYNYAVAIGWPETLTVEIEEHR